jgi:hypothetical protein
VGANFRCRNIGASGVKSEQRRRDGVARARQRRGSLSRRYRDIEPHPGTIR